MRESVLEAIAEKGFLPPKEVAHWRAPRTEDFPQTRPGEVVSFLAFHERGLGYPTHWFLCGVAEPPKIVYLRRHSSSIRH